MKKFAQWFGIFCLFLLMVIGWFEWPVHPASDAVQRTRSELRQQGFKTDLEDFNFTLPADVRDRAAAITMAGENIRRLFPLPFDLGPMEPIGSNTAVAVSQIQIVETEDATNLWPELQQRLAKVDPSLDAACAAILSGPLRYQPENRGGGDLMLPYLMFHKTVADTLLLRAVLAMHEHDTNGVFTNLLALSKMVSAWTPNPIDIDYLVRAGCLRTAQTAIWEAMQTDGPTEAQLAALQHEWESVDLFAGLADTAETSCATATRRCQLVREETSLGRSLRYGLTAPLQLISLIMEHLREAEYRNHGSYQDERMFMVYYHDRYLELQRALTCTNWLAMRAMPGATNTVPFQGAAHSPVAAIARLKRIGFAFGGQPRTVLSGMAQAEARRRLIVTALALERYCLSHDKHYPDSLSELVPAYLPAVPVDFMDGQALRYKLQPGGRYLLYSVGLDCQDDGGMMKLPGQLRMELRENPAEAGTGTDLIWPIPASAADIEAYEKQQAQEQENSPYRRHARFP